MPTQKGPLRHLRVLELDGMRTEYCGLLLAGLGADVVKVDNPGVASTRDIGPFHYDSQGRRHSIHHWVYNRGKRSVALSPHDPGDQQLFRRFVDAADVVLDGGSGTYRSDVDHRERMESGSSAIWARVTDFGTHGPWARYRASDLVHLALGGVAMNCGYDPQPDGHYELPPVAPQAWHAYHITGENLAIAVLAAVLYRERTGRTQVLESSVHEAVAKNTEQDFMSWIMLAQPFYRQTCRHAGPTMKAPTLATTKDGRFILAMPDQWEGNEKLLQYLKDHDMEPLLPDGVGNSEFEMVEGVRVIPGATSPKNAAIDVVRRYAEKFTYEAFPWVEAQARGMLWAPIRKPHENLADPHWQSRGTFGDVWHDDLRRFVTYPVSKWISTRPSWSTTKPAPEPDADRESVLRDWTGAERSEARHAVPTSPAAKTAGSEIMLPRRPLPLEGMRILDFTWFLASSGATRWLAALGAEVIKVEWKYHPDSGRGSLVPEGGHEARRGARAPVDDAKDPRVGGQFNNKNAGKRGISLNLTHPKGLEIAKRLLGHCDVVTEGFSPGVLERLGFGYEVQRALRPDVIYVKQSGMGALGTYGRVRTLGPVAAALSGITELSGNPDPHPPAGWGYSYLDWFGAYSMALAVLSAAIDRNQTGVGQWIDASQAEVGIFLTGSQILDYSLNGAEWRRCGNGSPYIAAAPHGIFRCAGQDRWIALACFTDDEWMKLCDVMGQPDLAKDARFSSMQERLNHEAELNVVVTAWSSTRERYELMEALQGSGIAAGVCQTMEDRYESDPQLAASGWLTEVTATGLGRWPVAEFPVHFSETPPHAGGPHDRGAPLYGEDNELVYGRLLGLTAEEIAALREENVM